MFELVRQNKRRSIILAFIMLIFMLSIGYIIGAFLAFCLYYITEPDAFSAKRPIQRSPQYHYPNYPSYPAFQDYPYHNRYSQYPQHPYTYTPRTYSYTTAQTRNLALQEVYYYTFYYWGPVGAVVAFVIWALQMLIAYFSGGNILLSMSKARKISKEDHPQLYNIVEEMKIASRLPKMPEIYIIDDLSMNAFATGRSPEHSAVAVTRGLLTNMNRDQLQGVIAHEISHIVNRDTLYMTILAVSVGTIILLVVGLREIIEALIRGTAYSSRYTSRRNKEAGAVAGIIVIFLLVMYIFALILSLIAPLLAMIIYFASSRRREYLADANAVVLTRYPEGLASALEKIADWYKGKTKLNVNQLVAPMYIVNPLEANSSTSSIFSTHPPIEKRISILRAIASSPSFQSYEQAWKRIESARTQSLKQIPTEEKPSSRPQPTLAMPSQPVSSLQSPIHTPQPIPPRPQKQPEMSDLRKNARMAGDALLKAQNYRFYRCYCGVLLKIPPSYKGRVTCPRCRSSHTIG